jgi:glycosyltransferase involved in cell wall biosynthesis
MDISVITPSLNMLDYLRRCHASVADQTGVAAEHIVLDACSTDGTVEWLQSTPDLVASIAPDDGMYDAINRGLGLATGDIWSYLNCDEQYLPGTLQFVREYFDSHPEVDVISGDTLLVRPDGTLISYRKTYSLPLPLVLATDLHMHTSSLFFRRSIVDKGNLFDKRYRYVGDQEFVIRLMRNQYRFAFCHRYFSAFTMTGQNIGVSAAALCEGRRLRSQLPRLVMASAGPLHLVRWAMKFLAGAYFQRMPLAYAVYDSADAVERRAFVAHTASFRWRED